MGPRFGDAVAGMTIAVSLHDNCRAYFWASLFLASPYRMQVTGRMVGVRTGRMKGLAE
jgi:hypothetical protein